MFVLSCPADDSEHGGWIRRGNWRKAFIIPTSVGCSLTTFVGDHQSSYCLKVHFLSGYRMFVIWQRFKWDSHSRIARRRLDGKRTKAIEKTKLSLTSITGSQTMANVLTGLCKFEILYKTMPKSKEECKQLSPIGTSSPSDLLLFTNTYQLMLKLPVTTYHIASV